MKVLYLIPARGGSKGVPKKNIKLLNEKPLINYSIEFARKFTSDQNICVSTDDQNIINCVEQCNLKVPFKRPKKLATDSASSNQVILHAIDFYESKGVFFDTIVLLQPTSPFRKPEDLKLMLDNWNQSFDLYASVKNSHDSPYFNLFEEDNDGFLIKSKKSDITRRQDSPKVYSMNGSLYIYNVNSLKNNKINKIKKYIMVDLIYSIDIDTNLDWMLCETVINNKLL